MDSLASRIHASFDLFSLELPPFLHFRLFLLILQGIAGATGVSNFLRAFLMLSLWGRCGRRRRRYSPCSRRCAGFAWRSGCRAQCAARSAGEGRRGRGWWRTDRSREWERWTQGETHMYMDDMTGLRTWATRCMWPNIKVWRRLRALSACSEVVHLARVHVIVLVVDVVCLMLVISARVIVHAVIVQFS